VTRRGDGDERSFQFAANELVSALYVLLKVAMVHDMNNRAVGPAIVRFRMSLEQVQQQCGEAAALQFVGDGIYVNQRLVRAELEVWEKSRFVRDFLAKHKIAEVAFHGAVPDGSIRDFVRAVRMATLDPEMAAKVADGEYQGISFRDLDAAASRSDEEALVLPDPVRVLRAFGVVLVTSRDVLAAARAGERAPALPLRRAVQELVRLPRRTRALQLGLLALEQYRSDLAGRLARAAVLVVMMGHRAGLKVGHLRDLGVSAVLAGVGRAFAAGDEALAPAARCAAAGTAVRGARWIAATGAPGPSTALRAVLAADVGQEAAARSGHPFSRLLAVVDAFEDLTAPAPHGAALPPHEALKRILSDEGLDRRAARLLVSTVGLFPVGSMVRLSTGEVGIVTDTAWESGGAVAPRVMVIGGAGAAAAPRRTVDLTAGGAAIAGTMVAADFDLNVGHFLFA
jgi:HD-GYP domain-containing protein (c-di-GMP phosphodiesterase class II)